jgi:hypothetical protein
MSINISKLPALLKKHKRLIVVAFFFAYLLLGLFIYKDYGYSYDEGTSRGNGAVSANYINSKLGNLLTIKDSIPDLKTYTDRDYGVLFELILIGFEYTLGLKDPQKIFQMRHLLTFIMFWISVIFFYHLLKYVFIDWMIGLLGCLFLVISPRIFAHSFYNSKDIILLSFCIISTYTLIKFLDKKTFIFAAIHAISTAAVVNIRIVGTYIFFTTVIFLGIEFVKSEDKKRFVKSILPVVSVYVVLCVCFTYIFWPYLWENPVSNFIQALKSMSKFRWDSIVFYWGNFINADELPWHYVPSWLTITTPVVYLLLFITGLVRIIAGMIQRPFKLYRNEYERANVLFLLLFFIPLFTVILLRSVLYDGWRQMFFIYPPFLCVSLTGFTWLSLYIRMKFSEMKQRVFVIICLLGLLYPAYFMIKYHPYQNVYFNLFAGKNVSKKFDLDYWGLSFKEAFEYITSVDTSSVINLNIANVEKTVFFKILKEQDRKRLRNVPVEEASYYVSNYRLPEEFKKYHALQYPYVNEIFSVKVGSCKIAGVYKLNP